MAVETESIQQSIEQQAKLKPPTITNQATSHNSKCPTITGNECKETQPPTEDIMMEGKNTDKELIDKLLRMVKREVKQIMEEAVTRKFVHEDSSSITALCGERLLDVCQSKLI